MSLTKHVGGHSDLMMGSGERRDRKFYRETAAQAGADCSGTWSRQTTQHWPLRGLQNPATAA